jgi:tetratricopeptide (TPR) repeat protein
MNLASVASELGELDRAVDEYREAARLQPKYYAAQLALALALQKKSDDKTAIPEFEKARKLGPNEAAVPLGLGASLEKVGRTADAVKEYQEFLKLQPNSAEAARVRAHLVSMSASRP